MSMRNNKLFYITFLVISILIFSGFTTSSYTTKVEPLPNMPEGNPDLSLGIVVRPHSTGRDVVGDSSQNIRFRASKNYDETDIELLRSPSIVDKTPKKFKFMDEKHSLSSDNIYEFSMMFNPDNHEWDYFKFMPFCSVNEWVTEAKLREYLNGWVKKFEDAGWKRVEYQKSDDPRKIQNFSIPTHNNNHEKQYCSWKTSKYRGAIYVTLRDSEDYQYYIPKKDRKNIKEKPDGYVAFIHIERIDN
ncbi:MAG: hypothetical protein JSR17_13200 [Proteobacteria bacterium]|nr:hypothetical protein [Pseudomonadota bacterium]